MLLHSQTVLPLLAGLCLMAASAMAGAAPDPPAETPRTYTNPVWERDFPDPFVLRWGDRFYAYATQNSAAGFQVMESPDLVRWTHRGACFKPPWASTHYWAPEVFAHRGQFALIYSALNPETRKHDIGIATAESPLGPFTHRAILVRGDANRVGVIDATLFFDHDGTPYLIYSEEEPRRVVLRRMAADLLSVEEDVTELLRPDRAWERGVTEAPTLIRRNGVYHLFFSVGWFQSNKKDACYAVCHASATSLRGPYTKSPKPLLATVPDKVYGPGHQCLVAVGEQTWMVYHAWDDRGEPRYGANPAGRTMRIDRLRWEGDLPMMDGPTVTPQPSPAGPGVRFGITADAHLQGSQTPGNEAFVRQFHQAMREWQPDFVIDLGDFACQCGEGETTPALHDAQLEGLRRHWAFYSGLSCPAYIAMGNHDVGWLQGGDEAIEAPALYAGAPGGDAITKRELLEGTRMPGRFYSFDARGYHFLVLDGNNWRGPKAVAAGRDGVAGAYWIDDAQKAWVARDLAANRGKPKIVFCHEELHHTPAEGSREGGDRPFPAEGKEASYVDNGWELRELFARDGEVLACFAGHKHRNRWTVHGGVHYITLAATHWEGSFARVSIAGDLRIEGAGQQRTFALPLDAARRGEYSGR